MCYFVHHFGFVLPQKKKETLRETLTMHFYAHFGTFSGNQKAHKLLIYTLLHIFSFSAGGKTGIRTLGPLARTTVFETAPFDRSGIFPGLNKNSGKNNTFLPLPILFYQKNKFLPTLYICIQLILRRTVGKTIVYFKIIVSVHAIIISILRKFKLGGLKTKYLHNHQYL